jgi:hypothetical protein
VDASFEEGFGWGKVEVIRRNDGNGIDAVRTLGFGGSHFGERSVRALRSDVETERGFAPTLGIRGERSCDEFVAIVEAGGDAVDGTDETAGASSDHPETKAARCR